MTKILVVEDEEAMRAGIAKALRARGHEVDEAGDGEEGLERLKAAKGSYGLVICDVAMPVLDGLAMLKAAGDKLGAARVLLMSGYAIDAPPELKGRPHHAVRKPIAHAAVADEAGALLAA
jgi:CheY-like chemotaxis protein